MAKISGAPDTITGGVGFLPVAGDLSGVTSMATVVGIDGDTVTRHSSTYFVDPSGDPSAVGDIPSAPTTLDSALATVSSGDLIVLSGGAYPAATITTTCTLTSRSAQSSSSPTAAVRITGLLTIQAINCRVVGIELVGGILDTSGQSGPGTTVLEQCSAGAAITVQDADTTTLELHSCTHAAIDFTGTNTTAVCRAYGTVSGGTITNATTGLLTVVGQGARFAGVDMSVAGTLAVELVGATLTAGISRSAGSVTSILVQHCNLGGGIDATGAADDTVTILSSVYDAVASVITEAQRNRITSVDVSSELSSNVTATPVTTTNSPASPVTYLSLGSALAPIPINPAHDYILLAAYTVQVSASNTVYWGDLQINGGPSVTGPLIEPLGVANAQAPRAIGGVIPGFVLAPGGSIYLDIVFAKQAGTGDVTFSSGYLSIRRVS